MSTVVWALSGLAACQAQGPARQRGAAIEFSAPKSGELTNSLRQLTTKKDSLKQLEEDLYRPFKSFGPDSLPEDESSMPLPMPGAGAGPSKRERQEEDRRKNWAFMRPEDLMGVQTVEELMHTPEFDKDGREKQSLSVMEQYFLRVSPDGNNARKPGKSKERDPFGNHSTQASTERTSAEETENGDLPDVFGASGKSLKKLIEGNQSASAFDQPNSTFGDAFGLGHHESSPEELLAHKARMEEFRQILEPSASTHGGKNGFDQNLVDSAQGNPGGAAGLNGLPGSSRHDGGDASGGINPLTATLPDLSASLNAPLPPKLTPTLPPVAPPSVTPPVPTFLAPRRQF